MNKKNPPYNRFDLVKEMFGVVALVRNFDFERVRPFTSFVSNRVLLSGEGSSRIFPAKKVIADSLKHHYAQFLFTEGATQAMEYDLRDATVALSSNSGRTKETIQLIRHLKSQDTKIPILGIAAYDQTPVLLETDHAYLLSCGEEKATAATLSVIEQALFYDVLFRLKNNLPLFDKNRLADALEQTLSLSLPEEWVSTLAKASQICFAGRNDGVAEELRLKTNEIMRKKSDFFEGTYAAHGVEEVLQGDEAIVFIDPFENEEEKLDTVLRKGTGVSLLAIATEKRLFPTFVVPDYEDFNPYIQLVAGWNLLVECGIFLGVDLDKPKRARKIGNEFLG